jgi:hypothetical protein
MVQQQILIGAISGLTTVDSRVGGHERVPGKILHLLGQKSDFVWELMIFLSSNLILKRHTFNVGVSSKNRFWGLLSERRSLLRGCIAYESRVGLAASNIPDLSCLQLSLRKLEIDHGSSR